MRDSPQLEASTETSKESFIEPSGRLVPATWFVKGIFINAAYTSSRNDLMDSNSSVLVFGEIRFSNGQLINTPKPWEVRGSAKKEKTDATQFDYRLNITNGMAVIEYSGMQVASDDYQKIDNLCMYSRNILEIAILANAITEGIGFQYTLTYCRTSDGKLIVARPDQAPKDEALNIGSARLYDMLDGNSQIRFALRDFNSGLIDRENCPFLFYRTIESLAKAIVGKDALGDADWNEYHTKIGSSKKELALLETFGGGHRYGIHKRFEAEDHVRMMRITRSFIVRTLNFLAKTKDVNLS